MRVHFVALFVFLTCECSGLAQSSWSTSVDLSIVQQPSEVAYVGHPLAVQPLLELRNSSGGIASSGRRVVRAFLTGPGLLYGTTSITSANGVASFSDLTIVGRSESVYRLSFSATDLPAVFSSVEIRLFAGEPSSLSWLVEPPAQVSCGVPMEQHPSLVFLDAGSNILQKIAGNMEVVASIVGTESNSGRLEGSSHAKFENGKAVFQEMILVGKVSKRYHLRFEVVGFVALETGAISLVAGTPASLQFSREPPAMAVVGESLRWSPSVRVVDSQENVVPWEEGSTGLAEVVSDLDQVILQGPLQAPFSMGLVVFDGLVLVGLCGLVRLKVSALENGVASSVTPALSQSFMLQAGRVASLSLKVFPPSTAPSGLTFLTQPVIALSDLAGNIAVEDFVTLVRLSLATPDHSPHRPRLVGPLVAFSRGGFANFSDVGVVGLDGSTFELKFSSDHLPSSQFVSFAGRIVRGPPSFMQIETEPSLQAVSGQTFLVQPAVGLLDPGGNSAVVSGVTNVTASLSTGVGSLIGNVVAPVGPDGVARFTDLALTGVCEKQHYRLHFSSSLPLGPVESDVALILTPGAPSALALQDDAPRFLTSVVGSPVPHNFVILLVDSAHNRLSSLPPNLGPVVASILKYNDSGASLDNFQISPESCSWTDDVSVSFTDMQLSGPAAAPILVEFRCPSLPIPSLVVATVITLSPGSPRGLFVVRDAPSSASVGKELSQQPHIETRDAGGNRATLEYSSVVEVFISEVVDPPTGTEATTRRATRVPSLGGGLQVITIGGIAQFTNLFVSASVGTRLRLGFSSLNPGILSVNSSVLCTVSSGVAVALTIATPPPAEAAVGIPFSIQPSISLWDLAGNLAQSDTATIVTAALCAGYGRLEGTTVSRSVRGVATFSDLSIVGSVGDRAFRIHFRSNNGIVAEDDSHLISLRPGLPSTLSLSSGTLSSTATCGQTLEPQPVISLLDHGGNAITFSSVLALPSSLAVTARLVGPGAENATLLGTIEVAATFDPISKFLTSNFTDLSVLAPSGTTISLQFFSSALPQNQGLRMDGFIRILPGVAVQMHLTQPPPRVGVVGQPLSRQPIVQLVDIAGNNAANDCATVVTAHYYMRNPADDPKNVSEGRGDSWTCTSSWGVVRFSGITLIGKSGDLGHSLFFTGNTKSSQLTQLNWESSLRLLPGLGVKMKMTTLPSDTASVGVPLLRQPSLSFYDAGDNFASSQSGVTVTAEILSRDGSLRGVTRKVSVAGEVEFSDLTLVGPMGSYWLLFSAYYTGVTLPPLQCQTEIQLVAGAAVAMFFLNAPPTRATVGAPLTPHPEIELRDAGNNVAISETGMIVSAVLVSGPAVLEEGVSQSVREGTVAFTNLILSGVSQQQYRIYFVSEVAGISPLHCTHEILLQAGGAVRAVRKSPAKMTAVVGQSFLPLPPTLLLLDAADNIAAATSVRMKADIFVVSDGGGSASGGSFLIGESEVDCESGECVFGNIAAVGRVAVPYRICFSSASPGQNILVERDSTCVALVLSSGLAVAMHLGREASAEAKLGIPLSQQPSVLLVDAGGNLAVTDAGKTVTAALYGAPAEATLLGTTVVTASGGEAHFTDLTILGKSTSYMLHFTSMQGLASVRSTGLVALSSGASVSMSFGRTFGQTAIVGVPMAQQPTVLLRDAGGNMAIDDYFTTVTARVSSKAGGGGAVLGGTFAVSAGGGIVAFSDLSINAPLGDSYTLGFFADFSSGILSLLSDLTISVSPGPAHSLRILNQAENGSGTRARVGLPLVPQPSLQLFDAGGNLAVGDSSTVVTVALHPPHASLLSNSARSSRGQVSFSDLTLVGSASISYRLHFAAAGFPVVHSPEIWLESGAASAFVLIQEPSSFVRCGVPFDRQPIVQLLDAVGNLALLRDGDPALTVTATAVGMEDAGSHGSPKGVVLLGNGEARAAVAMIQTGSSSARFSGVVAQGASGSRFQLSFSSGVLKTSDFSTTVSLTHGFTARLGILKQPSSRSRAGEAFPTQPEIVVLDSCDNTVFGDHTTVVWVDLVGSGGVVIGSREARVDGGVAIFSDIGVDGQSDVQFRLQFSTSKISEGVVSAAFDLEPGVRSRMVLVTEMSSTAVVGQPLAQQPVLALTDRSGNRVVWDNSTVVHAVLVAGSGTLRGTTAAVVSGGLARFTDLALVGNCAASMHLHFLSPGLPPLHTETWISVLPGRVTHLSLSENIRHITAVVGHLLPHSPTVQLRDESGNLVHTASSVALKVDLVVVDDACDTSKRTTPASEPICSSPRLHGTLSLRPNSGLCSFNDLSITGKNLATVQLRFSSNDSALFVEPVLSPTRITLVAVLARAASLDLLTQPSVQVSVGVAFPRQPEILLRDAGGNIAVGDRHTPVSVSLRLRDGSSSGHFATLQGSTEIVALGGRVSFTDLRIVGKASLSYSLVFRLVGSESAVESEPIRLTPVAPVKIVIEQDVDAAVAVVCDSALLRQPIISMKDTWGNNVGLNGTKISVALDHSDATILGSLVVVASSEGFARFTDLRIRGGPGSLYSLRFFSNIGLPHVVSPAQIRVTEGVAAALAIETEPAHWTECGLPLPVQPKLRILDICGNSAAISGTAVVEATLHGDHGKLSGATSVLTETSALTFNDLSLLGRTHFSFSLVFSSSGISSVESAAVISVRPGAASRMTLQTQLPQLAIANEILRSEMSVLLWDKCGNAAKDSGVKVRVSILQSEGSGLQLGGEVEAAGRQGQATFRNVRLMGKGMMQRVQLMFSATDMDVLMTDGDIVVRPGDDHDGEL